MKSDAEGGGVSRQADDTEEEDEEEDRRETASAAHEFEWLGPRPDAEDPRPSSCQASPVRHHHRHRAPPRCAASPTPRHHLSPLRSTWCCPSPPQQPPCCRHHHHAGSVLELACDGWASPYACSPCGGAPARCCSPPVASDALRRHPRQGGGCQCWQTTEDVVNFQKIHQLESDKKTLLLQTSVLAEQIDAQSDKINELERLLEKKKDQLSNLEENLHQEMLNRSNVENNKLELLTELSNVRLRLTASERDRKDSDDRCRRLENDLVLLHARLNEKEMEHFAIKNKIVRNGSVPTSNDKCSELEKLQFALDSVMVANDEKDRKIDDLRLSLNKYKKLQEFVLSSHTRKESDCSGGKDTDGDGCSDYVTSSSLGNEALMNSQHEGSVRGKAPKISSSTPNQEDGSIPSWKESASPISIRSSPAAYSNAFCKSSSLENICPAVTTTQPKASSPKSSFGTLPRHTSPLLLQDQFHRQGDHSASPCKKSPVPRSKGSGVTFGKGFFKLRSGGRSSSAPELAPQECINIPVNERENDGTFQPVAQPYLIKPEKDKNKGFLKFFSKWKRTGSQNIEKLDCELKRGGVRATAGPRLGWTQPAPAASLHPLQSLPFEVWDAEQLADWLQGLGLGTYASDFSKWTPLKLLDASSHHLEKELNMKHPLHRKKLLLALKSVSGRPSRTDLPATVDNLDHHWVVRWLDDIGLPQYKDAFADARVDGRLLHYLTVDDLLLLKVVSQLHHISIKCGIQVLRENNFDPHCLVRRSFPDELSKCYSADKVALWSNHRVMEWLRTVDLSEYAPNLRGSGVHGALIVYESKFNADLFATLLNIPPTKTLLRRHLATHFKNIVGSELMQLKRDRQTDPLSPSVKIKSVRKNQFALKKRRGGGEGDGEEYVCPMEVCVKVPPRPLEGDRLVVRRNSDPVSHPAPHHQTLLGGESALEDSPTTIV